MTASTLSRQAVPRTGLDLVGAGRGPDLTGLRLGLVTNDVTLTSDLRRGREALVAAGLDLRLLFTPEHGLTGLAREGALMGDEVDPVTGLPVRSLYGDTLAPSGTDLAGLDAVLYDLPDVGSRFYTYMWTLSHVLEACAAAGTRLVVLDRPNPIGGDLALAEGPMLDEERCQSFVGRWSMPIRHSLTIGELARWWVRSRGIDVELEVVPVEGWTRDRTALDGAAHWTPPSPAMPSGLTALLYPGTCLFEGVNLAEGRSTAVPFRVLGAPWLDAEEMVRRIRDLQLPGLLATPYPFTPLTRDHAGEACQGVLLAVTDAAALRPVRSVVRILSVVAELHGDRLEERTAPHMPGESPRTALEKLFGQVDAFAEISSGQWDDPSRFDVPQWAEAVADSLLYR
ncbi:exo-beta-N-acetylmuramidase NamZ domain-containing protein [Actinotalea sp. K2]|uniref:exo-beta-N-acetylmuramidase NamZ family protein n=1 Tax=Actinotalea sp. K2 TaxID=2939438 RepID=UPI0020177ECC|nr:DUF1343 domain-containing protein [Actinotalea sp. K2]MCL3861723.1 DUF1343 domain-containing protein [Actinotalea sp. K2]